MEFVTKLYALVVGVYKTCIILELDVSSRKTKLIRGTTYSWRYFWLRRDFTRAMNPFMPSAIVRMDGHQLIAGEVETLKDRELDLAACMGKDDFVRMVAPSCSTSQRLGNSYTTAVYVNLATLVHARTKEIAQGDGQLHNANVIAKGIQGHSMAVVFDGMGGVEGLRRGCVPLHSAEIYELLKISPEMPWLKTLELV
ncbi:hypothetical protein PHYPSEUDO_013001 [Phytophthora pseudosyringae]|uniref:Uncharacterized protein n=1 Tax=Phytophthora pseudosyringae TaxID=221518 RepID=A0A8T1W933_9STRA|nr:hypothetical protein PHYPSEUDO_013001 [Phytophthora pseudosyringae]